VASSIIVLGPRDDDGNYRAVLMPAIASVASGQQLWRRIQYLDQLRVLQVEWSVEDKDVRGEGLLTIGERPSP
jgi:hypothetical protein